MTMQLNLKPVPNLIHARFDIQDKYDEPWREIYRVNVPAVPRIGEFVGLDGNPMFVTNVSWSIRDGQTYAFIQVVKTRDYNMEL
jgi:hypothetical protein